jgi:hydroxymethylglutaryl-CoA reductase (NADPH)
MLHTRGKRVVAEATIPNELLNRVMRSDSELMFRARQVSNLGGFMSGVNNNGAHSANGITAIFIATGPGRRQRRGVQRGVRLHRAAPQRRLLLLGDDPVAHRRDLRRRDRPGHPARVPGDARCFGKGGVRKFTEIVAATVLCGELSLGSAIVAEEWVEAHDLFGRNR